MCLEPRNLSHQEYFSTILQPVGQVVVGMEREGIPIDKKILWSICERMDAAALEARRELKGWCPRDINWNSWVQLAEWLHGVQDEYNPSAGLGLPESPYCKKGEVPDDKISTDDRALEWLAGHSPENRQPITILRKLRQYERMARYARDWLGKALLASDGTWRLHPSFGLASDADTRPGAKTGRFGVKNPPLNQVPRNPAKDPAGMRAAFIPPPGMRLVVVDYSQLEVVILAHLISVLFGSDDPLVQRIIVGSDIHGPAAKYIFGTLAQNKEVAGIPDAEFKKQRPDLRDLGKIGIYGKNYGKSIPGFAWSTFLENGEPLGMAGARLLNDGLDQFYPGVPKYQDFVRAHITATATITSLLGRWFPLPNAKSNQAGWRNRAWRQALNWPMQAGGQEVMALALIAIVADRRLTELGFVLSLVVHDEIVGWCPEKNADEVNKLVNEIMCSVMKLTVPFRAVGHHGTNWKEAK